ncbi:MAG: hypothetical protein RBR32_05495 [Bacteroidales bacterium]|nr:hypothetical protein [Bacteroidales bacterium]
MKIRAISGCLSSSFERSEMRRSTFDFQLSTPHSENSEMREAKISVNSCISWMSLFEF